MLASFLAAAVALLPVLLMALSEIFASPSGGVALGEPDDAGYRGAGLALAAMPFLYIAAVPVCYAVGALLLSFRLLRFLRFLGGASAVAISLGVGIGVLLSASTGFGLSDVPASVAVTTLLCLATVLPAASCWWFFAVRPHNPSLRAANNTV
ncbi:MAG: hypothetical protein RR928_16560 [Comamonas sp.]|uniref:hypothetical protein n=2 Tax=Comamonas sp. TaxID=34028 RepID=UPI002FC933C8